MDREPGMKMMKRKKKKIFFRMPLVLPLPLLFLALPVHAGSDGTNAPLITVSAVDLNRYLGNWYEIASYPAWFQKGITEFASAALSGRYVDLRSGSAEKTVGDRQSVQGENSSLIVPLVLTPGRGNVKRVAISSRLK